jgi:hypothetical protein
MKDVLRYKKKKLYINDLGYIVLINKGYFVKKSDQNFWEGIGLS